MWNSLFEYNTGPFKGLEASATVLAASVHSGPSVEAEPWRETLLADFIDLLTVMGWAAGGGGGGGGDGGVQKSRYSLLAAERHPSSKELFFFLTTRKVNPRSMKM